MGVLKRTWTFTAHFRTSQLHTNQLRMRGRLLSAAPLAMLSWQRDAHSTDLTKNMQYISQDKMRLRADPATMKLNQRIDRPLCIILNWLLARKKHIMKYAAFHLEQGFDVLSVSCTPWQLMWPMRGAQNVCVNSNQLIADDLLRFLASNQGLSPLTVHAFSVGGYIWGELCVLAMKNQALYQPVLERVAAQMWDSTVDVGQLTEGVPAAIFPDNQVMQKAFKAYLTFHLKQFNDVATVHYRRASHVFYHHPCRAPALFLLSKSDVITDEATVRSAADTWQSLGIKVTWKCWERSPHVQHLTKHPEEYAAALHAHYEAAGLISHSQPDKMRMRL